MPRVLEAGISGTSRSGGSGDSERKATGGEGGMKGNERGLVGVGPLLKGDEGLGARLMQELVDREEQLAIYGKLHQDPLVENFLRPCLPGDAG